MWVAGGDIRGEAAPCKKACKKFSFYSKCKEKPLEGSELARSGRTLRHDGHVLHSALNNTAATGFLVQLLGTENVAAATEELEKSSLI